MSPIPRPVLLGVSLISVAALGLAACGAGGRAGASTTTTGTPMAGMPVAAPSPGPSTPPVEADAVTISNFKFGPDTVSVKAGTTVTWTNTDDEAHTVFFAFDGSRSPILVNSANRYTKTFTVPGTFVYHCTIHPFMTGTVVVTP